MESLSLKSRTQNNPITIKTNKTQNLYQAKNTKRLKKLWVSPLQSK